MTYSLLYTYTDPGSVPEAGFNGVCDNEHVASLLAVPGWLRIRRFRLVSGPYRSYSAQRPAK
jgi:hypothetical protein